MAPFFRTFHQYLNFSVLTKANATYNCLNMTKSNIFFFLALSFSVLNPARAVTWEILDPCTGKIRFQGREFVQSPFPSAGTFSVAVMKKNRLEFVGGEGKVHAIYGTPVGHSSVEIQDDRNMWAYGWCYEVNGLQPGVMPDQFALKSNNDHIRWFYAFTEMKNGQWLTMCKPSHLRPFKNYCR